MKKFTLSDLGTSVEKNIFERIISGKDLYDIGSSTKPLRKEFPKDIVFTKTAHEDNELFLILQGVGELYLDGEFFPVAPGDVFLVEPHEQHFVFSDNPQSPVLLTYVHFK